MKKEEKKFIKIIDSTGKECEYEIITAFKWLKTKKNYVVYTDNTVDNNGNLNLFAGIYYPEDSTKLDLIETDEEWQEIEKRLSDVFKG